MQNCRSDNCCKKLNSPSRRPTNLPAILFWLGALMSLSGCAGVARKDLALFWQEPQGATPSAERARAVGHGSSAPTQPADGDSALSQPMSFHEITRYSSETPPEELQAQLEQQAESWLYGPGIGRTMLNIGTTIVFPPYGLYLLGNAGLALAGLDPVYLTDILPETPRQEVLSVYDRVASVPGRVAASIAGREEPITD